jgi:asparagine synthase (glutamine-hydrolysing)
MCGIAGTTNATGTRAVAAMLDTLAHRGPDGRGVWHDRWHTLGHARLSVIDLDSGAQPMSDSAGLRRIVFNGEIYNYRDLRRDLGATRFRTQSDTESILCLAETAAAPGAWISRLDGMFAFALTQGPDLMLARDPLGIKPLYLGRRGSALLFASELKALHRRATGIREFPAGHVFSTRGGLKRYYQLPRRARRQTGVAAACRTISERLEAAVCKRLVADVPVGVFLSGGLDSSLIAALARRHKNPLDTFYVGTKDSPDRAPARLMAEFLRSRHHERDFTIREAIAALPEVIYYLESFDCALVRSAIPNYFLAKLASEHVTVALSGEGADELFAGYEYLKDLPRAALSSELLHITAALHNTNLQRCDRMSMAHGLEVRVPFLDVKVVDCAFRLPTHFSQHGPRRTEKWILRKVAEKILPCSIAWRKKAKFAAGSGLGDHLAHWAARQISDSEFNRAREIGDGVFLRSKEELLYYKVFRQTFSSEDLLPLVGRSRSI